MKTYTIDNENNISVFASKKEAAAASTTPFDPFTSQEELAELVAASPASRLVEIWNSMPGVAPAETAPSKKVGRTKKAPKAPKVAKPAKPGSGPREGSKTAQVVAMLQREGGATLAEIMTTMAWQKHTVRGFMAGAMKKAGY